MVFPELLISGRRAPCLFSLFLLCLHAMLALQASSDGDVASSSFPPRRMRMIFSAENREQLPVFVEQLQKTRGAINLASCYCYSVGILTPNSTLPQDNFCWDHFTQPVQRSLPEIQQHPIIQMGGENALTNFGRAEIFTKLFVAEALKRSYSGYFLDVEFHGDEHYDAAKKYRDFLHVFGSALHANNLTMTVLSRSVDSHATPASILNVIGGLDGFVVEEGSHDWKEIEAFVRAMGYRFRPRGGALLYPHGELNSRYYMQAVLQGMTQSGCQELAFFANFKDMGDVMIEEMKKWLQGEPNITVQQPTPAHNFYYDWH